MDSGYMARAITILAAVGGLLGFQATASAAARPEAPAKVPPVRQPPKEVLTIRWETETYPGGNVKKKTPYKGDKIHGTVTEYSLDGKITKTSEYVDGVLEGKVEEFFDNGKLKSRTPYKAGKIEGELEEYWDVPAAPIQAKHTYAGGLKNGPMTTWHHNGNVLNERTYKDDKIEGVDRSYHPTGTKVLATERNWSNGLQDGLEKRYDNQSRLGSDFSWKAGKKHGLCHVYHFSGEIRTEEEWSTGGQVWRKEYDYYPIGGKLLPKSAQTYNNASKLHGKSEFWRANGSREKILEYADGVLNGTCEYYDENDKLIGKEQYANGEKLPDKVLIKPPPRKLPPAKD